MKKYFKDSFAELKKITWPDKETSVRITIITIVFTAVITLLITVLDNGFNYGYETLLEISPSTFEATQPSIDFSSANITTETSNSADAQSKFNQRK